MFTNVQVATYSITVISEHALKSPIKIEKCSHLWCISSYGLYDSIPSWGLFSCPTCSKFLWECQCCWGRAGKTSDPLPPHPQHNHTPGTLLVLQLLKLDVPVQTRQLWPPWLPSVKFRSLVVVPAGLKCPTYRITLVCSYTVLQKY